MRTSETQFVSKKKWVVGLGRKLKLGQQIPSLGRTMPAGSGLYLKGLHRNKKGKWIFK
jgi:hypothetical protein